jgi:hypothetical protein
MTERRTGAGGCGAIRFACEAGGAQAVHCFCRDCQKATGGAFAMVVGISAAQFALLAGSPKRWAVTGTSGGRALRQFCGACGSPLSTIADHAPGMVFVKVGAFDDPSWLEPRLACWTSQELPWARMPRELPGVARNP